MKGAFHTLDGSYEQLRKSLDLKSSGSHYKKYDTCFQFLDYEGKFTKSADMNKRVKVYNKLVDLILKTSVGKKIGSGITSIFKSSTIFHHKLLQAQHTGISRIEVSYY